MRTCVIRGAGIRPSVYQVLPDQAPAQQRNHRDSRGRYDANFHTLDEVSCDPRSAVVCISVAGIRDGKIQLPQPLSSQISSSVSNMVVTAIDDLWSWLFHLLSSCQDAPAIYLGRISRRHENRELMVAQPVASSSRDGAIRRCVLYSDTVPITR
jgi:hypothetical protein